MSETLVKMKLKYAIVFYNSRETLKTMMTLIAIANV